MLLCSKKLAMPSVFKHVFYVIVAMISHLHSVAFAEYGFLQFKPPSVNEGSEVCAAFNAKVHSFPLMKHKPVVSWKNLHQIVNLYPSFGCFPIQVNCAQKYVIVQRGNCTFEEKALFVQRANGIGIVVVSNTGLDVPGANESNDINISLSVITLQSYSIYTKMQEKHDTSDIRVVEYTPLISTTTFIDYNAIVMWCLAVLTLAVGAGFQAVSTSKCNQLNAVQDDESKDQLDLNITPLHAVIFFCMCSVSILLMYFFYDYLVYIIIVVFCYASALSMFDLFYGGFKKSSCFVRLRVPTNNIPLFKKRPPILGILLFLACTSLSITWVIYRKASFAWVLQDILGCSFCIYMIKTIRLPNFKVCTLLLVLFFVYDVFYVFITPLLTKNKESIMMKVATGGSGEVKEELPMLFKLPKFALLPFAKCGDLPFSMLGYGDVILPGLHVGFCAVWDSTISQRNTVKLHSYYLAAVASYGIGLMITFVAMYFMMTGQPALLYLVPCCLISTLLVAMKRNELHSIWNAQLGRRNNEECSDIGMALEENHSLLDANEVL